MSLHLSRPNFLAPMLVVALAMASNVACRSKLSTTTNSSIRSSAESAAPTPPEAPPVQATTPPTDISDGLIARTYLQSRSVAILQFGQDLVGTEAGSRLTLVNLTNRRTLLEGELLTTLPTGDAYALLTQSYDTFLRLYPESGSLSPKFAYGENKLQATLDVGRSSTTTVWLKDFTLWSPAYANFSDNSQEKGGFQGWVSPLQRPAVSNGSTITTTFGRIVNK